MNALRYGDEELGAKAKIPADDIRQFRSGHALPTTRQLETLARCLHLPFAAFFCNRAPRIRIPKDHRTLGNQALRSYSRAMLLVLEEAQFAQTTFSSILKEFAPAAGRLPTLRRDSDPYRQGMEVRKYLGLTRTWQVSKRPSVKAYFAWRAALENHGVLTLEANMESDAIRGFCYADEEPFVIAVSSADPFVARIYSMLHELGHVCLREGAISGAEDNFLSESLSITERFCNRFAFGVVLPHENEYFQLELRKASVVENGVVSSEPIARLARRYSVSRPVILYALREHKRISLDVFRSTYKAIVVETGRRKKATGGPLPSALVRFRKGERLTSATLAALRAGAISTMDASGVLGVKSRWVSSL